MYDSSTVDDARSWRAHAELDFHGNMAAEVMERLTAKAKELGNVVVSGYFVSYPYRLARILFQGRIFVAFRLSSVSGWQLAAYYLRESGLHL